MAGESNIKTKIQDNCFEVKLFQMDMKNMPNEKKNESPTFPNR